MRVDGILVDGATDRITIPPDHFAVDADNDVVHLQRGIRIIWIPLIDPNSVSLILGILPAETGFFLLAFPSPHSFGSLPPVSGYQAASAAPSSALTKLAGMFTPGKHSGSAYVIPGDPALWIGDRIDAIRLFEVSGLNSGQPKRLQDRNEPIQIPSKVGELGRTGEFPSIN